MNKILRFTSLLALSSFMMVSCGENSTSPSEPPSGAPTLESISLSGEYQTSFFVDDAFDYEGLVVTATYSDESSKVISSGYTVSTPDMSTKGEKEVTVAYLSKTAKYSITIIEPIEEYAGYMYFDFYRIDILKSDKSKYYLNPGIKDKDNQDIDVSDFPFTFTFDSSLVDVSKYGGISSKGSSTGSTVITCTYTVNPDIKASCTVNIVDSLPTKEKVWVRVDDYDSLSDGDILVMASPEYGLTASLDTLHSKLNPVTSTFSSDKKTITSLGEGTIEFYLGIEEKGMTLEAQTNEYLVCTHQGKVKLDSSSNTNKYWDIHANYDLEDGAVIENDVESLGYFMYNVSQNYFSTYVNNSISEYMKLPFIYRLEEVN